MTMGHAALLLALHLLRRAPRVAHPVPRPVGVVLVYHGVTDRPSSARGRYYIPADRFVSELVALEAAGYRFVSPSDFVAMVAGHRRATGDAVLLTFDDGLACDLTVVTPILERFHAHAIAFLIGDRIGRPGYLTAADIRAMARTGLWTFGSHTYALHTDRDGEPALIYLSRQRTSLPLVAADVRRENATFQSLDLPKPTLFAFPFGAFDSASVRLLRHDYTLLFTSEAGVALVGDTLIPRLDAGFYNMTPGELVTLVHRFDPLPIKGVHEHPRGDEDGKDVS
jgi:biofilm PGA synthesis lipoprotein PgaB